MSGRYFERYFQDMEPFGCGPGEFEPREERFRRRGFWCPPWHRNSEDWRDNWNRSDWNNRWGRHERNWDGPGFRGGDDWKGPRCHGPWNRWNHEENGPEWFEKSHDRDDRRRFFEKFGPAFFGGHGPWNQGSHGRHEGRCGRHDRFTEDDWKNFFENLRHGPSESNGFWNRYRDEGCCRRRDRPSEEDWKKIFEKFGPGFFGPQGPWNHHHNDWNPGWFGRRNEKCHENDWNNMFEKGPSFLRGAPWGRGDRDENPGWFGRHERHSEDDWKKFFERFGPGFHQPESHDSRGWWGRKPERSEEDFKRFFEKFGPRFGPQANESNVDRPQGEKNPEDIWRSFMVKMFFKSFSPWNHKDQNNEGPGFGKGHEKRSEEEWKEFFSKFGPGKGEGGPENHWKEFFEKFGPQFFAQNGPFHGNGTKDANVNK